MVRQDIVAGIRNAIERGSSLENAKQTMINSGYNKEDITEAANYLTGGLGDQPMASHQENMNTESPQVVQSSDKIQPMSNKIVLAGVEPKKKSNIAMIVILVSILVILIGILVVSLLYKEDIVSFFQGLF